MNTNLIKGKFGQFSRIAAFGSATASLLFIGIIPPADANAVDRCGGSAVAGCANGYVSVYKDVTSWDLTVKDNGSDGNCVYANIIIDRNNLPNTTIRTQNACGKGKTVKFPGNAQYSGTRGARVEVCLDLNLRSDKCTKIHYEYEIE
jgi:hypothetical protein